MRTSTSFAMFLAGAASLVVASLSAQAPAHAGPYLGLGIGTAHLRDDGQGLSSSSASGRLELGQRFSILAVEGALNGYQLSDDFDSEYNALSASGGGRVHLPLTGPLSVFARAGVERTWLRVDNMADYDGNGYYGGLGAELRLALPLGETAVWIDYTQHRVTLDNGGDEIDGDTSMWTPGISVGL